MRFWCNNRLDCEFALPAAQVVELFAASQYWDRQGVPLDHRLRLFLTDSAGPIASVFEEDEYAALFELVLDVYRERKHSPMSRLGGPMGGVVLVCSACRHVYEPDLLDWESGNTGCRRCGGWTWIAELVEPNPTRCPTWCPDCQGQDCPWKPPQRMYRMRQPEPR